MRIAVLLTTFNRKDKTLACLKSLSEQNNLDVKLQIFITDDGSKDGTAEFIKKEYPYINIYEGTGSLFWAGGMRNSWQEAMKEPFDFFLLLNDDTVLKRDTLNTLINTYKNILNTKDIHSIIVGSTLELNSDIISYGGKKLVSNFSVKSKAVYDDTLTLPCDLGNANIMLVPEQIVSKIGILSKKYTHGIADYDYTLRAIRRGFGVHVAPGVMGYCVDDHGNNWLSPKTSLKQRIAYLKSPKGLAYKEYLYFTKTFFPLSLPTTYVKLWAKTLFPILWEKLKVPQS